jgi:hypothetical protein
VLRLRAARRRPYHRRDDEANHRCHTNQHRALDSPRSPRTIAHEIGSGVPCVTASFDHPCSRWRNGNRPDNGFRKRLLKKLVHHPCSRRRGTARNGTMREWI